MAKPRVYGMINTYNPKLWSGINKRKKTSPRPREKMRNPVADRLTAQKEEAKE